MSVSTSNHTVQFVFEWRDNFEIVHWSIFSRYVGKNQISLKSKGMAVTYIIYRTVFIILYYIILYYIILYYIILYYILLYYIILYYILGM